MSGDRAIDPLPLDQFPQETDTQDPGFEELFNQLVGDAGTPADGFEDDVDIANSLLDQLDGALTGLSGQEGGTLDDTFADILAVDPAPAGDDVVNLSAAIPDVQTNVDNLGNLLTGAALPAPPTPGAGGMQVQTATGPVLACQGRQGFGYPGGCGGFPCISNVPFSNTSGVQQTIASITLVQAPGGPWTVTTDAQPTFQPGQTYTLRITATRAPAANETAQVQIYLQGISQPAVFCMDAGVGGTVAPGGGGGGPVVLAPAP